MSKKKHKKVEQKEVIDAMCAFCEEDFEDEHAICRCRKCNKPICETHRSVSSQASGFAPEYNCTNCED